MIKRMMLVKAVPGRMFPNYEALKSNVRRFVARRLDVTLGHDILDAKGQPRKSGAFVIVEEGELVPVTGENIQAVRNGDIAPGNEECSRLCGLIYKETL